MYNVIHIWKLGKIYIKITEFQPPQNLGVLDRGTAKFEAWKWNPALNQHLIDLTTESEIDSNFNVILETVLKMY